ncbi:hypothetical protein ACFL2J_05305 [Candidatus Omnitrophota bacterium]
MRNKQLIIILVLIALICLNGCKSINVGGTGQIGGVTGSGHVSIPVLNADDQSSDVE